MKNKISSAAFFLAILIALNFSCKKDMIEQNDDIKSTKTSINSSLREGAESAFNLEVTMHGTRNMNGHIHFRQNPDPAKIITLDVMVHNLMPNHEYQLWRAVDTILDGNCTGTNWLALGKGLTAQSILTNQKGDGSEELWRSVTAIASGTIFDIHFEVRDKANNEVVLSSDCHQYTVR